MNISLAPEVLFHLGSLGITNAVFSSFVIFIILVLFVFILNRKLSYDKPGKLQLMVEMIFDGLYGLVQNVMELKYAKGVMSFVLTFFVLILLSNWFGLMPFVPAISLEEKESTVTETSSTEKLSEAESTNHTDESIEKESFLKCLASQHCYLSTDGIKEFKKTVHVFRAPSSDLSFALTIAIISVIVTNILGFAYAGKGHLSKFINFSGPIPFFVGILEIVSEIGKLISFSFRLFGNIFAGEILLVVITSISFGLATLPFLLLEIFVGAIQAFVFFMLTSVFIGLAVTRHEH
ncbi:MAG: F0F1 ATP synthase subunit A [bacterium]